MLEKIIGNEEEEHFEESFIEQLSDSSEKGDNDLDLSSYVFKFIKSIYLIKLLLNFFFVFDKLKLIY